MQTSSLLSRFRSLRPFDPAEAVVIRAGAIADYDALARHHYRAARPATCVRVIVAEREVRASHVLTRSPAHAINHRVAAAHAASSVASEQLLVGVLVVSMPTLNGAWRRLAWPDLFPPASATSADSAPGASAEPAASVASAAGASAARSRAAQLLNTHVRCISRLVVHPDWRALGIGRRLVEAYLETPLTGRTEAVSAMGRCSPVFEAAGMRRVEVPDTVDDARLRDVLGVHGLQPPDLLDLFASGERLTLSPSRVAMSCLRGALRSWAWRNRGCRGAVLRGDDEELARLAAGRLVGARTVFVSP